MSEVRKDQRRPDGSLRHLLTLEHLSRAEIQRLLNKAQTFVRPLGSLPPTSRHAGGRHSRQPVHRTIDSHTGVV